MEVAVSLLKDSRVRKPVFIGAVTAHGDPVDENEARTRALASRAVEGDGKHHNGTESNHEARVKSSSTPDEYLDVTRILESRAVEDDGKGYNGTERNDEARAGLGPNSEQTQNLVCVRI